MGVQPEVRGLPVEAAGFTGRCVLCRIFEHGARFTARCAGLQPEVRGLQVEAAGLQVMRFMLYFRARGKVYSPRCGVYRSRRQGLHVVRFNVVWVSSTAQGLQPEVRGLLVAGGGFYRSLLLC